MKDSGSTENDFLNHLTEVIEENMSNEMFGVSELAGEIGRFTIRSRIVHPVSWGILRYIGTPLRRGPCGILVILSKPSRKSRQHLP